MKRHAILIIFILILLIPFPVFGQPSMFAGYDSFCGLPVLVESTPKDAVATIRNGERVIIIDPSVMSNWKFSRVFAIAHECGHHILGHMSLQEQFRRRHMNASRSQELDADCWAAKMLDENGYYSDIERTIILRANEGPFIKGPYPSGMERATNIARCVGIDLSPPGFPSGYVTLQCGCWVGTNPPFQAYEEKCASKQVILQVCPGWCPGFPQPNRQYGYVCQ